MAAGDVVKGFSSVANGAYLDILPTTGQEWVIQNIRYEGPVEFYITTDGVDLFKYDSDTTQGARLGLMDRLTPSYYIKVKNTDTVSRKIAFDGIQTK